MAVLLLLFFLFRCSRKAVGIAQAAHVGYAESSLVIMLLMTALRILSVLSVRINVMTSPTRSPVINYMIHSPCLSCLT